MEFLFFAADDSRLFTRNDAESATWTVEELSLHAIFPYDPEKPIQRGQRIGFVDATGEFQPFEIRQARSCEPDHYQEITAEHIAVAELSDEHQKKHVLDAYPRTAYDALHVVLGPTIWNRGENSAFNTSNIEFNVGSVWQAVRDIEQNWNVYITPRVVLDAEGIIGRYLDVAPAKPVWRGLRLSLDKNADEVGVTWDDTSLITAIYGYGGTVDPNDDGETEILTFADAVWAETIDHPAKASGATVLIDPVSTSLYGRNGRPRYGYYQNSEITDAEVLLEKSWEALKNSNAPDISIDCQVRDLYRMGYDDVPIQLHDLVIIDVRPTGETLQREIIRLTVDLLDSTATRVTIGKYIPNIVYRQRDTQVAATGSGGGGRHGIHGTNDADGQDNRSYEFQTSIQANQYLITLHAQQLAADGSILAQAGLSLDAHGVLIYADDNPNMIGAKLKVQADQIALVVTGTGTSAKVNSASIVAGINAQTGSYVKIQADKIDLVGYVTASSLEATLADAGFIETDDLYVTNNFSIGTSCFMRIQGHNVTWQSLSVLTSFTYTQTTEGYITAIDGINTTIYYLGYT